MFVPWIPSYGESQARSAVARADCWADALEALGLAYHGKSINTLRTWCARWGIETAHLRTQRSHRHRYTDEEARQAIANSYSWSEALRKLGYCHTGANPRTLKKRAREWGISTEHFDRYARLRDAARRLSPPLEEILVRGSTYSQAALKRRLYEAGLKRPQCELCGQDENWRGRRMSMILDHVNGVRDDNRLENLRIVCPTARRRSIRTADARTGTPEALGPASDAGDHSSPTRAASAIARALAALATRDAAEVVRAGSTGSVRAGEGSSAPRVSSCWPRSRSSGTRLPGAGTESPTTPSASGFVSTSASARWPRDAIRTASKFRPGRGRAVRRNRPSSIAPPRTVLD